MNQAVQFTETSINHPTSWSWNFGDATSGQNNTSTLQNPTHTYVATGSYTVTLMVTTGSIGGGDVATQQSPSAADQVVQRKRAAGHSTGSVC